MQHCLFFQIQDSVSDSNETHQWLIRTVRFNILAFVNLPPSLDAFLLTQSTLHAVSERGL